ncbi:PREDICTED: uncharacterized protein LOC108570070 [Habropoda laboriosa]|uniref:uncharacterized protein LOC108570070 n=1 Tax=Habropoda laboriosa TaxID=597456 RepID=UPI00083E375F|nr:PREDICTED: uncharacterized protein LOC108570070 [Habropoda laboriosa]
MYAETVEERFMKLNKVLGLICGVWPRQNSRRKLITQILSLLLMASSIVTQIANTVLFFSMDNLVDGIPFNVAAVGTFVKLGNYIINETKLARMLQTLTVDVIVEQVPFFFAIVLLLCKQGNYIINTDKFEYLLDSMCEDWNQERSYKEIGIMKKYGQRGNLLSRFYVVNAYICSFLFIQVPWSTRLVNSYKTQNITPSLPVVVPGYYFVDEVEYYYYIILHGTCTILIVVVVYCACDTSYMVLVQHTCGLFAVAGYRFKNSIREDNSVKGKYFDHWTKEAYKNACFSIQGHQRAINFVKEIERGHDTYLFTCLGLVILCFSITLIKLSTSDFDIDFYRYCSFTLCQLMHLFVIMLQGQFVLDSCERIHEAIYESLWYTSSSKTQALYVVALRRNLTPTCLTAGGLVQLNMQSFAEVVKMSVSYYTVLKTT